MQETGTCAQCGRAISNAGVESGKADWYHDNPGPDTEGHEATPKTTGRRQSARVGPGPSSEAERCQACWGKGWTDWPPGVDMDPLPMPTCTECDGTGIRTRRASRVAARATKAIAIYPDKRVREITVSGLSDMQAVVQGYIEPVTLSDGSTMYVNEEYLFSFTKEDVNWIASDVCGLGGRPEFMLRQPILGPVLIVGPLNNAGDDTDVTDKAKRWVQRVAREAGGKWASRQHQAAKMVFDEWFGEITYAQRAAYRKYNVSPSDHRDLVDRYGESNHDAIVAAVKRYSWRQGMFSSFDMWDGRIGEGEFEDDERFASRQHQAGRGTSKQGSRRTATWYCTTHDVYVGDGNRDTHAGDGCNVEQRKSKETKDAESSRHEGVAARDLSPGTVLQHPDNPKHPATVKTVNYSPGGGGRARVTFEDGSTHTYPSAHHPKEYKASLRASPGFIARVRAGRKVAAYCEDYPACGHTPDDPCDRQWYDEPGAFDTSRPGNEHALCEHEHGLCEVNGYY